MSGVNPLSADQSLAVATNAMCVIAFSAPDAVSATFIAEQTALNPVVVRRALGKLVTAGLVLSTQGSNGGYCLAQPAKKITLQDVYEALSEKGVFERNYAIPQASCEEGQSIGHVLAAVFGQAESSFANVLRQTTLAEVLKRAETG